MKPCDQSLNKCYSLFESESQNKSTEKTHIFEASWWVAEHFEHAPLDGGLPDVSIVLA